MIMDQQLLFLDKNYKILCAEQEFIIHPAVFGLVPLAAASLQCSFTSTFQIKDYRLILDELILGTGDLINYGMKIAANEQQPIVQNLSVSYNGAILVGADLVKEYYMKGNLTCFSYQRVVELIFEDGVLITTIDHSKAMSRIRKNIELGLRSLYKSRDARLIKHFINNSFVGDYKTFLFDNSRLKYIKEMKKDYSLTNLSKQNKRIE
ncbi:MAG: hypothetical protein K0S01_2601 [Herbinix sp.]|jgi:hypothetical protein|nr:hypothetical protein [Herbinix sp.]